MDRSRNEPGDLKPHRTQIYSAVSLPTLTMSTRDKPDTEKAGSLIPGSAEFVAGCLSGLELACPHFPKYRADGDAHHQRYPSRLGFFHASSAETRTSYLDTGKLCIPCLDAAVPDGFNYWSTPTPSRPQDPSSAQPGSNSNNAAPVALSLFRAGTEGFVHTQLRSGSASLAARRSSAPASIFMHGADGAKETWQWLEAQRKPFYMNELHLTEGWSPQAQLAAAGDSQIAEKIGKSFVAVLPGCKRKHKSPEFSSASEPGPQSASNLRKTVESTAKPEVLDSGEGRRRPQAKLDMNAKVGLDSLISCEPFTVADDDSPRHCARRLLHHWTIYPCCLPPML